MTERDRAVAAAIDDIRNIEAQLGVTRPGVEAIRDRLIELASHRELFPLGDFAAPGSDDDVSSFMYRLAQDDDDRFALYAQATSSGTSTPVHNHETWAVVVGFDGQELNRFYERTDTGVAQIGEHMVEAGTGVAMLPDDLHAIEIHGASLNFHCYGLALERLEDRVYFNETEGRWKSFAGTSGIREARPDLLNC